MQFLVGGKTILRRDLLSARALRPFGASVALIAASIMLAGCGGGFGGFGGFFNKKKEEPVGDARPPQEIYGEAENLLDEQDYSKAAKKYEDVDINHPYSTEARRAIVMSAYAYYKEQKYSEAISASKRYLTLHPGTDEAPLAQNIIAMSYYDQVLGPKRDQTNAREALNAYERLAQRYPESRYAAEARNRVRILRNVLAAHSMTVGRYYLREHDYLAAINRFRDVVTNYQKTEQIEEALTRLTEAYLALGIVNEAETAAAVLGHNFPNSKWYQRSYALLQKAGRAPHEHAGSWITRTFRGEGNPA